MTIIIIILYYKTGYVPFNDTIPSVKINNTRHNIKHEEHNKLCIVLVINLDKINEDGFSTFFSVLKMTTC